MPTMCVASGCHQKSKRGSYVKFYSFPRDPVRRNRWISALRRAGWTPASHSKLCSMHFITVHASEVILDHLLTSRIEPKANVFLSNDQFGFRNGVGTRDDIAVMRLHNERYIDHEQDVYECFVDYEKAFNRVNMTKSLEVLKSIGDDWCDQRLFFMSGRRSDDPLSPDYVPSWFAHTTTLEKERSMAAMRRYKRSQETRQKRDTSLPEPAVATLGSYKTGFLAASLEKDKPVYASFPSLCEEHVKRSLMEVQTLSRNSVLSTQEVSRPPSEEKKETLHPTSFHELYCLPESIQWTEGAWEKVSREKFVTKRKKRYKHTIKVNEKWEWLGVDLKGPLPETQNGNKFILTLMDYYSKWVEAYPMKSQSAGEVALNIRNLTYQFGWPLRILSQMDKVFIREVNTELGALLGEQDVALMTFHPEASTRDTVSQSFIDEMVSELVRDDPERWDVQLPASLFALRLKQHPGTGHSPFFMLYRKEPRPDFSTATQELPLREDLISSSGLAIPEVKFASMQRPYAEPPRLEHIVQTASLNGQKDDGLSTRPVFLVTPLPLASSNTQQSNRNAAGEHMSEPKSLQDQKDENSILTGKRRRPRSANTQHPARRIVLQRIHPEDFSLSV